MANPYFRFKRFTIRQDRCAMKVTTDASLFGAWTAARIREDLLRHPGIHPHNPAMLLDIGAGTGLLSLMIAQQCPVLADAVEIDPLAASQATDNVAASPWSDRVRVLQADIREFNREHHGQYRYVASNPPFYENELASPDDLKNLAHHSSHLLLDEVLHSIRLQLADNGLFFLLLPQKRTGEATRLINKEGLGIMESVSVRPSTRHDLFRVMIMGKKKTTGEPAAGRHSEMSVWNDQQEYTREFVSLLRDYYLYLT